MTAAKTAKELGAESLKQIVDFTGESRRYLDRIHKSRPEIFRAAVIGVLVQMERLNEQS